MVPHRRSNEMRADGNKILTKKSVLKTSSNLYGGERVPQVSTTIGVKSFGVSFDLFVRLFLVIPFTPPSHHHH